MLNSLDLCLLCDVRTVDGAGDAITLDRSRHGIHAQLGDGTTVGTMPTLDALNGRFTFDGNDYMVLRAADDVDDVLAEMGSIQDETYIFYIDPVIATDPNTPYIINADDGINPRWYIRMDGRAANRRWEGTFINGAGQVEQHVSPVGSLDPYQGKSVLFALTRQPALAAARSKMYVNAVEISTDNDVSRDGSEATDIYIGVTPAMAQYLQAGTSLRFMGYSRTAWTQTQLRVLQRFIRGLL